MVRLLADSENSENSENTTRLEQNKKTTLLAVTSPTRWCATNCTNLFSKENVAFLQTIFFTGECTGLEKRQNSFEGNTLRYIVPGRVNIVLYKKRSVADALKTGCHLVTEELYHLDYLFERNYSRKMANFHEMYKNQTNLHEI
jgi:hypothetical protein